MGNGIAGSVQRRLDGDGYGGGVVASVPLALDWLWQRESPEAGERRLDGDGYGGDVVASVPLALDWLWQRESPEAGERRLDGDGSVRCGLDFGREARQGARMKPGFITALLGVVATASALAVAVESTSLFDGKTFAGWEGDTAKTWRIEDGAIVGGSLTTTVPQNEFLATKRSYTNFVLRLKVKLTGTEGFVNSGVQIRSTRIPNHHEMIGYQADVGEGWWGCIYDESRRNKVLAKPDEAVVKKAVKVNDWNDYEIVANGKTVILRLNGIETLKYTEADDSIPQHGLIAVQIHGGGKGLVAFKDIRIEELP